MKQYTIQQVAQMFGVTRQCAWQWIAMRKLKAKRIGSMWVVSGSELEKFKKQKEGE